MRKSLLSAVAVLLFTLQLFAQRTVTGKVTDDKGNVIPTASVQIRGTSTGTVTRNDGTYTITVPSNSSVLVFSAVDMQEFIATVGDQTVINAILQSKDAALGEVVVTGYVTRRRTEFTGASTKVASKEFEQVPIASLEQMLQGQAPGVYIASGSGQPGSTARVNIRGVGSFGSVTPLYVLDGVPIEEGVFRTLNPNDFESIDVLKDAAGTGQYGSRGANGVVVITSKKGRSGRTTIQYRGQVGFAEPPRMKNLDLMNTAERLQYEEKVLGGQVGVLGSTALTGYPGWDYSPSNPRYQTLTPTQQAAEALLLDSIRKIDTDWADLFTRNAKFQQHEVNASGGNQNLSFYTSLGYYRQEGIIIRSDLERYTFRTNIDFRTERLTISLRSAAGFSQLSNIESEAGVALANPIAAAFLELPYRRPFRSTDGKPAVGTGNTGANAYDRLFTTTSLTNQFKGTLGITAQFEIWGGISLKSTNGVDWRNNNTSRFIDPNSYAGTLQLAPLVPVGSPGQGLYSEGNSENLQLVSTTGLVFSRTFLGKHVINAQAMMEAIRNRNRNNAFTGYGINPRILNSPAGITAGSTTVGLIPTVGGGRSLSGLFSVFAIADYTYDRRFTLSGSIRRDSPSQLPKKNRQNTYWTAGGSWNLIQENFMKEQDILQEARVRVSYGEVANINGLGQDFGYISTYGNANSPYGTAIVPTSPGNEDYGLETQQITNFGIELAGWNRRIRLTADYYVKTSKNLFLNQQISRVTGFFNPLRINAGEMENKGIELDLRADVVKWNDLLVTINANGAWLTNEITSLGQITEIAGGTGISRVGLPFGTHFIVGYLGVDPQSGLPVYQDINGNPTTEYNASNSRATFGTYLPKFTGGAGLDISWKGFSLTSLLHIADGIKRFNNESFFYETTNSNLAFNKRVEMLMTWQKPGDITDWQRISSARQFSSKDIQDASFVRLRNVTVGYTYTPKANRYIRSIRVWGQGQNLYTWTKWNGFDPEESNNIATYEFPNPKTYTLGIDLTF